VRGADPSDPFASSPLGERGRTVERLLQLTQDMLTYRIFLTVFPVFAIVAAGYLYGRWKRPDMAFANQLNMDVFVPALLIHVLASREFDIGAYQALALGGALVILGSGLLALPVARILGLQAKTLVPPMMFTNTGNIGLPLALLAFGEAALAGAVVLFIVANTLHFSLGVYIMEPRAGIARLFVTPVIVATILGLTFSILQWQIPPALALPVEMMGQVAIPLLLFSLGVRLVHIDLADWKVGLLGAVLCPLTGIVLVLLLLPLLDLPPLQRELFIVFGVLPPAVLTYMFAEQYRQEPRRVASIVMLGNLASIVTLPLALAFVL
jgi:malate permease and related proteins